MGVHTASLASEMAAYETYETDNDYDTMEMQNTQAAKRVAKAVNPRPQIERKRSNRKMTILLAATCAILLLLLLAIGGGVAVFLKSNCGESATTTTTTRTTTTTTPTTGLPETTTSESKGTSCNESTECYYKDLNAKRYDGCVSTTASGKSCQAWASSVPHNHTYTHLSLEENYCRTDDHTGPWCYTIDPDKKWEDCLVPICNDGSKVVTACEHWTLEM